ncbi:restriction endonuclease subunit S [Rhizobium johnstonii]
MTGSSYPAYRNSNVEWLGQIPVHWKVKRIAVLFSEVAEQGNEDLPILSVSIHDGVSDKELDPGEMDRKVTRSDDRSKYKRVARGDLVYNMMRAWQGGFGAVETDGMVSPAYVVARPKSDLSARFTELLLRTPTAVEEMRRRSRGVTDFRLRLYWEEFKEIEVAIPSTTEQLAILDFLDRETAKIDALVEQQKRLIELLKEKRQAVISQAVTKGLNLNVPVKDTGIEWLGKVPEHWSTGKLRSLARQIVDGAHFTPTYVDDGIPFLRVTDITRPTLDLTEVKRIPLSEHLDLSLRCRPEKGDLLLSKNGTIGVPRVINWDWEFSIFVSLCLIKLTAKISAEYLAYVFQSRTIESQIEEGAKQNTVANLHLEKIASFRLPVPPAEEQAEIVRKLDSELGEMDHLVEAAEDGIKLLEERRVALISAAVTGKINVQQGNNAGYNRGDVRAVVGFEIVRRFAHRPTFGRVKLQKILYLAESYAGLEELGGKYEREAAGPLDRKLIADIETLLQRDGEVRVEQPEGRGGVVNYRFVRQRQQTEREDLGRVLGDRRERFEQVLSKVGELDTKGAEAVATLFAVWNDALLDHKAITDEVIITGFLTEWHPEKPRKFKRDELQTWLGWMRRNQIVPTGQGPRSQTPRLVI